MDRSKTKSLHPMQARHASIRLLRGTLFVVVGQSQMRSRIFIQTPAADLTAFDLRTFKMAVKGIRTRAMSVRGKINFKRAGGAPMNLSAGYFSEWPSSETEPRAASQADAVTQAEVPQILRVEKRLVRLQKDFGFGFAPWKEH
ncbi:MAG: hypothetical protein ACR2II_00245 [Chthoniobacterales bacterium]